MEVVRPCPIPRTEFKGVSSGNKRLNPGVDGVFPSFAYSTEPVAPFQTTVGPVKLAPLLDIVDDRWHETLLRRGVFGGCTANTAQIGIKTLFCVYCSH